MAYIDKVKEKIGWLKVIFAISIATDISLIAWLIENFREAKVLFLIVGLIGVLLVTFIVVQVDRIAHRKIDELEDL